MRKRGFLRLSYVVPPQSELSVLVKPCTVTRKGYEDTSYVFPTWFPACGAFVARSGDVDRFVPRIAAARRHADHPRRADRGRPPGLPAARLAPRGMHRRLEPGHGVFRGPALIREPIRLWSGLWTGLCTPSRWAVLE